MMSITAVQPATTPIPVQLSEAEFSAFILPHLSMPKRGPKCKLGYHRLFNLSLWVLYTGMQWKCLPIPRRNWLRVFRSTQASRMGQAEGPSVRQRRDYMKNTCTALNCPTNVVV